MTDPHLVEGQEQGSDRVSGAAAEASEPALALRATPASGRDATRIDQAQWLSADTLEAHENGAPWQGGQPIEEMARQFKGRPWVPLEAAIAELQFWQRRDYEHSLALASAEATRNSAIEDAVAVRLQKGRQSMIGWLKCRLGHHNWMPVKWLTCDPWDRGRVCRRCLVNAPANQDQPHAR